LTLFDLEIEAKECANKGSALYLKNFENFYNWFKNEVVRSSG